MCVISERASSRLDGCYWYRKKRTHVGRGWSTRGNAYPVKSKGNDLTCDGNSPHPRLMTFPPTPPRAKQTHPPLLLRKKAPQDCKQAITVPEQMLKIMTAEITKSLCSLVALKGPAGSDGRMKQIELIFQPQQSFSSLQQSAAQTVKHTSAILETGAVSVSVWKKNGPDASLVPGGWRSA